MCGPPSDFEFEERALCSACVLRSCRNLRSATGEIRTTTRLLENNTCVNGYLGYIYEQSFSIGPHVHRPLALSATSNYNLPHSSRRPRIMAMIPVEAPGFKPLDKHIRCSNSSGTGSDFAYPGNAAGLDADYWKGWALSRREKMKRKKARKRQNLVQRKHRRRERRKAQKGSCSSSDGDDCTPENKRPLLALKAPPNSEKPDGLSLVVAFPSFREAICGGVDRDDPPANLSISFGDLGGPLCGNSDTALSSAQIPPPNPPASPPVAPWLDFTKQKSHFGKLIDNYLSTEICHQFVNQEGAIWEGARKALEPHFMHPADLTKSEFMALLRVDSLDSWLKENTRRLESRIIERRLTTHYALIAAGINPLRMPDRQLELCELMSKAERNIFINAYKRMEGKLAVFQNGLKLNENGLESFLVMSEVDRRAFIDAFIQEEEMNIRYADDLMKAKSIKKAKKHGTLYQDGDVHEIEDTSAVAENVNETLDRIQAVERAVERIRAHSNAFIDAAENYIQKTEQSVDTAVQARTMLSESENVKGEASSELAQLVLAHPDAIELLLADPIDIGKLSSTFEYDQETDRASTISTTAKLNIPRMREDSGYRSFSGESNLSCEDSTLLSHIIQVSPRPSATPKSSHVLEAFMEPTVEETPATEEETTPRSKIEQITSICQKGSPMPEVFSPIFIGAEPRMSIANTEGTVSTLNLSLESSTTELSTSRRISFANPPDGIKVVPTIRDLHSPYARKLDGLPPVGHARNDVQHIEYRRSSTEDSPSSFVSRLGDSSYDEYGKRDGSPRSLRKKISRYLGSLRLKKVQSISSDSSVNVRPG